MDEAVWKVHLLGGLRVDATGGKARVITRFRTQKTAALLAYLALNQTRPQPREVICELLWPDESASSGRKRTARRPEFFAEAVGAK